MVRERPIALAVAIAALALALHALLTAHPGFRLASALGYVVAACMLVNCAFPAAALVLWGLTLACIIVALIAAQVRIY